MRNSLVMLIVAFFDNLPNYFIKGVGGLCVMFVIFAAIYLLTVTPLLTIVAITVVLGIVALGWFLQEVLKW